MSKSQFIYSPKYHADFKGHVFQIGKYDGIYERLTKESKKAIKRFHVPKSASNSDLKLVHTEAYLDDFLNLKLTSRTTPSELPLTAEIRDSYILMAGGTIRACEIAVEEKTAVMNIGGGFHHAYADMAQGFCYINDIAVGIKKSFQSGLIKSAMVIDCDLHQGNGTAHIFKDNRDVFPFSIHQENNFPIKERSDKDIGLPDFAGDDLYLEMLEKTIPDELISFYPELVVYVAGADTYCDDQLGGLCLTQEGMLKRDRLIIGAVRKIGAPLVIVLAGGYAHNPEDTVQIHYNTAVTMMEIYG